MANRSCCGRGWSHLLLRAGLAASLLPCIGAFDSVPQAQRKTPIDREAGDQFGISVAVDSSAVPAYFVAGGFRNDEVAENAGKAYVFRRDGGSWTMVQILVASDGEASDLFGRAVAIDGPTLVIGAPNARKDSNTPATGAAYVYRFDTGTLRWVFDEKLTASDAVSGDDFGSSVAVDDDTIVVGALERDGSRGAAYAFARNPGTGIWDEQGKLFDPDGDVDDLLGVAVDVDGDMIVAGAYNDTVDTASGPVEKGSVSVFTRDAGTWSFDQKVFSPDSGAFINFGQSVALDAGELAVGAPSDTPPFLPGETIRTTGTVYRYDATNPDISSTQVRIWPSDKGTPNGPLRFGYALGLDANVLAIGAYADRTNGIESGSIYLFDLDDNLSDESLKITSFSPSAYDLFGFAVSVSGDDILVGADREDMNRAADDDAGAAYVYSVPEPGVGAATIASLATLALLRLRVRRGR